MIKIDLQSQFLLYFLIGLNWKECPVTMMTANMMTAKQYCLRRTNLYYLGMVCFLSALSGCGGVNKTEQELLDQLIPVTGKVTLKGEPLASASITLHPTAREGMTQFASAISDETGAFQLRTLIPGLTADQCKGVLPGTYQVVVSKIVQPDGSPLPEGVSEADAPATKQAVPVVYTTPERSPLQHTVTSAGEELILELK